MTYNFIYEKDRLKCYEIGMDVPAIVYNRSGPQIVSEAVFNISDEKFADLESRGMMTVDKIVIVVDVVGDNMTIEFLPE